MIDAYDVTAIRRAEERTKTDLLAGTLMKRAAKGLAAIAAARLSEEDGRTVVGLVGSGDNGGDTLHALARLARKGANVAAILVAKTAHEEGLAVVRAAGAVVADASTAEPGKIPADAQWLPLLLEADVILDGITGIGGRPGLSPAAQAVLEAVPEDAYLIAVDLPSGADPEGTEASACVYADETVTFGAAKPVHLLPSTEPAVGLLSVVDIGIGAQLAHEAAAVERLTHDDVAALWPRPDDTSDKYSRGVLGIVAGSPAYPGAAVLTVLGALGAGPGMVRFAGPPAVRDLVLQHAPEVVTRTGRVQAWVVGPGVELTDDDAEALAQRERVEQCYGSNSPVLVDASALVGYAERCASGLCRGPAVETLLTPHAGEAARMLTILGHEHTREEVLRRPVDAARRLADSTCATVLLKGATTLIVPPGEQGPVRSQCDAPAWIATAGAGDVLSGIIGTLLSAGLEVRDAAALGALVHGVTADDVNPGGPVRASAIAHHLPATIARLLGRDDR